MGARAAPAFFRAGRREAGRLFSRMSQIHQEVRFAASPADVYAALTDAKTFAAWSGDPAAISTQGGGAFSCFGPFIVGRQIELVVNRRIVQAWRTFNWPDGIYSLVRFEFEPDGDGTRMIFDQDGVPEDAVEHVSGGWHHKYWEPMRNYFES